MKLDIFSSFEGLIRRMIQGGMWLSAGAITLMVVLIGIDVSIRTGANLLLPGSIEMVEVLMVVVGFLTIAYTSLAKRHVVVELVASKLPRRIQATLDTFSSLIATLVFALISWQIGLRALENISTVNPMNTPMLHISLTPFFIIASLGSILFSLQSLVEFFHYLAEAVKK